MQGIPTVTSSSLRTALATPGSIDTFALLFLFTVVELLLRVVARCCTAQGGFGGLGVRHLASQSFVRGRCGKRLVGDGRRGEGGGALALGGPAMAKGGGVGRLA